MAVKPATQTRPMPSTGHTQQQMRQASLLPEHRSPQKDALASNRLAPARPVKPVDAMSLQDAPPKELSTGDNTLLSTQRMRGALNAQGQRVGTIINTYA